MLDWFKSYPSVRIEDIGAPYQPKEGPFSTVEYDYIIVGGISATSSMETNLKGGPQDAYLRID